MAKIHEPVKGRTEAGRRREQRARDTRQRIVTAARELFLDRGYIGTTVEAIAAKAGVGAATVYQAFGTKSAILGRALDEAIVADDEPAAVLERDWVAAARGNPDRRRRLMIVVQHAARTAVRTAPLKAVMRDAAATEPDMRELIDTDDARRLTTQRALVQVVLGGKPPETAVAAFFLLVNSATYTLAVDHLGWTAQQWERWLVKVLDQALLGGDTAR